MGTPDVELTLDNLNGGGANFIDDELEDDKVTGQTYAFMFWSQSGPTSLLHAPLTVEKNRVYNETTNQFTTPGQVRVNVAGGSVTDADIVLNDVADGAGTDADADDYRKAAACQTGMIFHFAYTPKVEIGATYDGNPTNLVLRIPTNRWPQVWKDGSNFFVDGDGRMDAVKDNLLNAPNRQPAGDTTAYLDLRGGLSGLGLESYQDII